MDYKRWFSTSHVCIIHSTEEMLMMHNSSWLRRDDVRLMSGQARKHYDSMVLVRVRLGLEKAMAGIPLLTHLSGLLRSSYTQTSPASPIGLLHTDSHLMDGGHKHTSVSPVLIPLPLVDGKGYCEHAIHWLYWAIDEPLIGLGLWDVMDLDHLTLYMRTMDPAHWCLLMFLCVHWIIGFTCMSWCGTLTYNVRWYLCSQPPHCVPLFFWKGVT